MTGPSGFWGLSDVLRFAEDSTLEKIESGESAVDSFLQWKAIEALADALIDLRRDVHDY